MVISVTAYQDDSGCLHRNRRAAAAVNLVRDFIKARDSLTGDQSISTYDITVLGRVLASDMNSRGRQMLREALDRFEAESTP